MRVKKRKEKEKRRKKEKEKGEEKEKKNQKKKREQRKKIEIWINNCEIMLHPPPHVVIENLRGLILSIRPIVLTFWDPLYKSQTVRGPLY